MEDIEIAEVKLSPEIKTLDALRIAIKAQKLPAMWTDEQCHEWIRNNILDIFFKFKEANPTSMLYEDIRAHIPDTQNHFDQAIFADYMRQRVTGASDTLDIANERRVDGRAKAAAERLFSQPTALSVKPRGGTPDRSGNQPRMGS